MAPPEGLGLALRSDREHRLADIEMVAAVDLHYLARGPSDGSPVMPCSSIRQGKTRRWGLLVFDSVEADRTLVDGGGPLGAQYARCAGLGGHSGDRRGKRRAPPCRSRRSFACRNG